MAEVEWGSAIGFLLAGLGIGALILWRWAPAAARRANRQAGADSLARRDRLARFDALIGQLRELEDLGGKRTAEQLASERYELELAAAEALVALDALAEAPVAAADEVPSAVAESSSSSISSATPAPATPARGSSLTGFFWGIGSAAALGLLFYFVAQSAQERSPGASVTGNTPMAAGPGPQSVLSGDSGDADLRALEARVEQNPEDLDARIELAREHLLRQDLMAVFADTREILRRDAENPYALTYQAMVRLAMGQADQAEAMLLQALQREPRLIDAYVHLMLVYTSTGRAQAADAIFERATQLFPEETAGLGQVLEEMKAGAEARRGGATPAEDPHAGVAGLGAGQPAAAPAPAPAAAAAAVSAASVAGVIELDAALAAGLGRAAVVFVTLRVPGVTFGPPLAARRLGALSFPLAFEIGQADSMTGAEIPQTVQVEVRLDTDGDLATRPHSDPYGRVENVRLGTHDLRISLQPRTN